jgi:hypothetical protein
MVLCFTSKVVFVCWHCSAWQLSSNSCWFRVLLILRLVIRTYDYELCTVVYNAENMYGNSDVSEICSAWIVAISCLIKGMGIFYMRKGILYTTKLYLQRTVNIKFIYYDINISSKSYAISIRNINGQWKTKPETITCKYPCCKK